MNRFKSLFNRDTMTTVIELVGAGSVVTGVDITFGRGWAFIVAGFTAIAVGWVTAKPPKLRDR